MLMPYVPLPVEWYRKQLVQDWQSRIATGRDVYQSQVEEAHRYSLIVGCADFFRPGARDVLDIGCGDGILQQRIRYDHYVGIDMSVAAIAKAQARQAPQAEFIVSAAETYDADRRFDVIVFNESLYYMPEPMRIIERVRGWLAPDGIIVVCMFKTYLARRLWHALEKTDLVELTSVEAVNDEGFTSVVKAFRQPGGRQSVAGA